MATQLDAILRPIAKQVLAQFGMTAALYRPNPQAQNDYEDAEVDPSLIGPYAVKVTPPKPVIIGGDGEVGSTASQARFTSSVAATDSALPSGYPPDRGWEFRIGSRVYFVEAVTPVYSGDQVALYKLDLVGSGAP